MRGDYLRSSSQHKHILYGTMIPWSADHGTCETCRSRAKTRTYDRNRRNSPDTKKQTYQVCVEQIGLTGARLLVTRPVTPQSPALLLELHPRFRGLTENKLRWYSSLVIYVFVTVRDNFGSGKRANMQKEGPRSSDQPERRETCTPYVSPNIYTGIL